MDVDNIRDERERRKLFAPLYAVGHCAQENRDFDIKDPADVEVIIESFYSNA